MHFFLAMTTMFDDVNYSNKTPNFSALSYSNDSMIYFFRII